MLGHTWGFCYSLLSFLVFLGFKPKSKNCLGQRNEQLAFPIEWSHFSLQDFVTDSKAVTALYSIILSAAGKNHLIRSILLRTLKKLLPLPREQVYLSHHTSV